MACSMGVSFRCTVLLRAISLILSTFLFTTASAQTPPTLTKLSPPGRTDLNDPVTLTLTGSGFTAKTQVKISPDGVYNASNWKLVNGNTGLATVTLTDTGADTTVDTVNIWVEREDGMTSGMLPFNTGLGSSVCLETFQSGECSLLWQVFVTSATGSSSQSNNSTIPNIMVKLDYLWRAPKNKNQKQFLTNRILRANGVNQFVVLGNDKDNIKSEKAQALEQVKSAGLDSCDFWDHLAGRLTVKTGYTQIVAATNVQPTTSSGGSGGSGTSSTTSCAGGAQTSSTTCTAAVPQQAFVTDATAMFGWSTGTNGQSVFGEFGITAHGSFEYLIPNNKVVTSGGLTYVDLSSVNPHDAVGFYEATGHFRLAQIGHNLTLPGIEGQAKIQNASDLLLFEAGYQNNRALQQLTASSPIDTRNRYVARFSVNPELPNTKHTQLTMGIEYSGGMNGGPHVVQLFFGTKLNPAKLFGTQN